MPIVDVMKRMALPRFDPSEIEPEAHHVIHSDYDQDIGVGTHERITALGEELGIDVLPPRTLTERLFNFVDGTALGLRLQEKSHAVSDEYVMQSPIRKAVAEQLLRESNGQDVTFVETCGLLELAGGYMMTIPILGSPYGGAGAGFGITANSLVRYRTSTPTVGLACDNRRNHLPDRTLFFPLKAHDALQMRAGSEFEYTVQGRVNVNGVVSVAGGYAIPGATAGVGIVLSGGTSVKGEINVNVMSLDQPNKVRVTVRKLDEKTAGTLARIRAGLIFSGGAITGQVAGGMLRAACEKVGSPIFEELVNAHTTLNGSIFAQRFSNELLIGSWDFDLTDEQGIEAYEALMHMNAAPAQQLAAAQCGGVREVRVQEREVAYLFGQDIGFLGQKLLIHEVLHTHRDGSLEKACGEQLVYRNSIWSKVKKNIFNGSKQIDWEAVSVKTGNGNHEPYLHFHFTQKDKDFGANRLRRMLRFADALEIPQGEMAGHDQEQLDDVSRRLSHRAEVVLRTDIYFTKQGVANIDHATAEDAKAAYLKVSSKIKKRFQGFHFSADDHRTERALPLMNRYRELTGFKNLGRLMERLREVPDIREQYFSLTGHKISDDARLLEHAEEFGEAVEELSDINSPEQVASFFQRIGRLRGFDYMQSVAALAVLATHEETLINALSVASGNLGVENISDGKIEHPRETIATHLHRTA